MHVFVLYIWLGVIWNFDGSLTQCFKMSRVCAAIGSVEQCIHVVHQLRKMIHLLIIFHPEGSKLYSTNTAQYHHLKISVWDNLVDHVCAREGGIPARNLEQSWLMDVDIDLSVLQIILKPSCECVIDVFPCDLDVFLNEQVCVCVHRKAHRHLLNHISSTAFNCVFWSNSLRGHDTCTDKKLLKNLWYL